MGSTSQQAARDIYFCNTPPCALGALTDVLTLSEVRKTYDVWMEGKQNQKNRASVKVIRDWKTLQEYVEPKNGQRKELPECTCRLETCSVKIIANQSLKRN